MEFAVSYSGGKESALALYKTLQQGYNPVALITTFNADAGRSHFHGLSKEVLLAVSNALDIPLMLIETNTQEYANNFEAALRKLKEEEGLKACVFGDIDIEDHKNWCSQRCENVGITPIFTLWGKSRDEVVYELIGLGFSAYITVVHTKYLPDDFLGKELTKEVAMDIKARGADICGENGEYHTFVSNGPIFLHPVNFSFGEMAHMGDYAMLKVGK